MTVDIKLITIKNIVFGPKAPKLQLCSSKTFHNNKTFHKTIKMLLELQKRALKRQVLGFQTNILRIINLTILTQIRQLILHYSVV